MQQYFSSNFENDPSRDLWNFKDSDKEKNSKIEKGSEYNIFSRMKQDNKLNKTQIRDNILVQPHKKGPSFGSELIEKEKEVQSYKFNIKQLEVKVSRLEGELESINEYQKINRELNNKLEQEYEKNKELVILRNKIQLLESQHKDKDKLISK